MLDIRRLEKGLKITEDEKEETVHFDKLIRKLWKKFKACDPSLTTEKFLDEISSSKMHDFRKKIDDGNIPFHTHKTTIKACIKVCILKLLFSDEEVIVSSDSQVIDVSDSLSTEESSDESDDDEDEKIIIPITDSKKCASDMKQSKKVDSSEIRTHLSTEISSTLITPEKIRDKNNTVTQVSTQIIKRKFSNLTSIDNTKKQKIEETPISKPVKPKTATFLGF